ncbi:MAG TPA: SMP-30/gluconolactonase/LRE family protein [Candidatus Binatia bacterium]|jgi:sugar lactone lactonase YvrE|nr:SMP-30/gluconolactonase/LRE family protein [Candidatus Binatia bacterium]
MATLAIETVEIFGSGVLEAEGVVIDKAGHAWGGGRNGKVYKVSPDGKVNEAAELPSGSIPNGVTLDRAGNFVYCDLGKKAVMRWSPDGKVSMIADRVGSLALSLPNFCSYDAEGNLYVSNSSTQDINNVLSELEKPAPNGALVRIRPDGRGEIVAEGIYFANGTAIDPMEDAVYVLESSRNDCLRIQIKKDGTFSKPEIYAKDFPALPDGMAFDVDRNLYVTLPAVVAGGNITPANQIIKVDTNGNWSTLIDDGAGTKLVFPTNCAFGGAGLQDLFIANLQGDHFCRVRTPFRGHPLYHQR